MSVLLLGFVFWRTDWAEVVKVLRQADPLYMVLSFLVGPLLVSISSWKWSMLLKAMHVRVRFIDLYMLYEIGGFFSNVLPTNVGGDVVRATALARATRRGREAVSSVFLERYTGLTALVVMAALSVPLNLEMSSDRRVLAAVALAVGGYLVLLVLILNPRYLPWLQRLPLPGPVPRFLGKVLGFQSAVQTYRHHRGVLARAILVSLLWNMGAALNVYLSARAFGGDVSFVSLLVTVPLILTITMVPMSFGGIGLSEWAYTFAFTQIGAGAALGLSVALLLRVKSVLTGGLGAGFLALGLVRVDPPGDDTVAAGGLGQGVGTLVKAD